MEHSCSCSCSAKKNDENAFEVNLTHQGKSNLLLVSAATTGLELHRQTLRIIFGVTVTVTGDGDGEPPAELLKLLFKGKRIAPKHDTLPFAGLSATATAKATTTATTIATTTKKKPKPLKIMVVATNTSAIEELATKRSDPLIRGFDQEKEAIERRNNLNNASSNNRHWADSMVQDRDYKFCRRTACTDHSFGHRSTEQTPHAFRAMELLEKMATDPGIVAVMKERELVVGTLGEMDPIDDRLMQKTEQQSGGCLLGYNTNRGLRIDIKLRTDDLSGFRPYPDLIKTLIHELSHNWVGEHDLLFWTNYAQMRAEYLYTHSRLKRSPVVVRGKKTAELAGLDQRQLENVFECIMTELVREMGQFGLHPNMIADPIRQRIRELDDENLVLESQLGNRLGGETAGTSTSTSRTSNNNNNNGAGGASARELALAAAERRAREQQKQKQKQKHNNRSR